MANVIDLLPALEEGTRQKKIDWQPNGETGVVAIIGENSVTLDWDVSPSFALRERLYALELRDPAGRLVERCQPTDGSERQRLEQLYQLTRRQADRVDEIVDDVQRQLSALLKAR